MIRKFISQVSVLCLIYVLQVLCTDNNNDPSIGFTCNSKRPAVYRDNGVWKKDRKVGCLKDPVEILRFCKKSFPSLAISNVVEWNEIVEIDVWCRNNKKRCLKDRKIRPYRCLVGPFQSDALLVPDQCVFDHEHNASVCVNSIEWRKIAANRCKERDMKIYDHSILLPCGIDGFNGVEFVCCPNDLVKQKPVVPKRNRKLPVLNELPKQEKNELPELPKQEKSTMALPTDAYHLYMRESKRPIEYLNDHEFFMDAKHSLEKQQHERISNMMKEWSDERQRVDVLRKTDGDAKADELNREITEKFQKTYSDLEKQSADEKLIFLEKHENHVETRLDNRKEEAMKRVLEVVESGKIVDIKKANRSIKKYIRAEMKDQEHYINRWLHLENTDTEASKRVLERYLEKLRMSNERIQQAVAVIKDHLMDNQKAQFNSFVEVFVSEFIDIQEGHQWMIEATPMPTTTTTTTTTTSAPFIKKFQDEDDNDDDDDDEDWYDDYSDDEYDEEDEDDNDIFDQDLDKFETKDKNHNDDDDEYDDEYDDEDDEDDFEKFPFVDKAEKNILEKSIIRESSDNLAEIINESNEPKEIDINEIIEPVDTFVRVSKASAVNSNPRESAIKIERTLANKAWVIAVVGLSGALMIGIILIAAVMRRKRQLRKQEIARIEAEPYLMDNEKRHLTSMQFNGYENPTYKYLEVGTQ